MGRRIRVAVVGAGYFARFHHDGWARIGDAELVAIVDRELARAEAAARAAGAPLACRTLEEALDAARPDLVDIATPPATHAGLVRATADRGLPAICQKAFCTSLAEARETVAFAAAKGTLLVVHENFRFQPWHRETRRLVEAGRLGRIYQATFRMRPGDGRGPDAYLSRQPYFQRMPRFLIRETGIHFVDVFRYLLGEVTGVMARLTRLNPAIAGEDAGVVHFDFAGGERALFDANRLSDHAAEDRRRTIGEMWLEGEAGTLRLDGDGGLHLRAFASNAEAPHPYAWSNTGFAGDSVRALQAHVANHLLAGTPVENTGGEYLRNLEIEDAIYRSSETGTYVGLAGDGAADGRAATCPAR
jgi:predicted dehydrogenase